MRPWQEDSTFAAAAMSIYGWWEDGKTDTDVLSKIQQQPSTLVDRIPASVLPHTSFMPVPFRSICMTSVDCELLGRAFLLVRLASLCISCAQANAGEIVRAMISRHILETHMVTVS